MMHANIAIRAPILRPMGSTYASTLQDWTIPSLLQPQTRIVRVLVLLMGGFPLSLIMIGSRYTSCFCRLNPLCFANMLRVLSGKGKIFIVSPHRTPAKTTAASLCVHKTSIQTPMHFVIFIIPAACDTEILPLSVCLPMPQKNECNIHIFLCHVV